MPKELNLPHNHVLLDSDKAMQLSITDYIDPNKLYITSKSIHEKKHDKKDDQKDSPLHKIIQGLMDIQKSENSNQN